MPQNMISDIVTHVTLIIHGVVVGIHRFPFFYLRPGQLAREEPTVNLVADEPVEFEK